MTNTTNRKEMLDILIINDRLKRMGFTSYHDESFWYECCDKEIKVDSVDIGVEFEECHEAYCPICETSFDWEPPDRPEEIYTQRAIERRIKS